MPPFCTKCWQSALDPAQMCMLRGMYKPCMHDLYMQAAFTLAGQEKADATISSEHIKHQQGTEGDD